jgi:hypothetical protein
LFAYLLEHSLPYTGMKSAFKTAAVIGFSLLLVGAIDPNKVKSSGKPVYYYPQSNVYFDTGNAIYTQFTEEDGWMQSENITEDLKNNLGTKAIIHNPSNPVWANNAEDRMLYSIVLYAGDGNLLEKYRKDALASLPKKPVEKIQEPKKEDEKQKGGIRRFFDKLFGKKKDS